MRGGKGGGEKEIQDSENKYGQEERAIKTRKKEEHDVLYPGCQTKQNSALFAV